jgi:hypothetical protein
MDPHRSFDSVLRSGRWGETQQRRYPIRPPMLQPQIDLGDISFDPTARYERSLIDALHDDSGREYATDGFSRRTLREITQDLRHDGHRPGAILVPYDGTDLFDGERLHYTGESTTVTDVTFHGWAVSELKTQNVLDGEAFVIAENALTKPTVAPVAVLVRHPDGVAHYRFGESGADA